jgi:hypothetical protein
LSLLPNVGRARHRFNPVEEREIMSRSILGLAAAVLISLPCAAMADAYPSAPVPQGVAPQRLSPRQVFRWLDTNHDGFLTLKEFLAAPWVQNRQRATRFFRWMDTNHNGLVSLQEFLAAYTRYCGSSGYSVRVAYPWAWTYWRPWRYGWYWQSGWHRRPGVWAGGVWRGPAVHRHPYVARPHHAVKHARPGKYPHPVKHAKALKAKHHGGHRGHGQHDHHR